MVYTLRRRYGRVPGRATYYAKRIKPLPRIPLSMRLKGIGRRIKRLNRYKRNAPAYRRMAVARGVRNLTSRYATRIRRRIIARRVGRRAGVGNYIESFL